MSSLAGISTSNFLDNLYREKFNREPDAGGKAYWANEINSGKMSWAKVAESFDQSQEMKDINADKAKTSNNAAIATAANNAASTAVNNLASTSGPSTTTITLSGGGNNNNNVQTTSNNSTVSNNNSSNNNNNN